MKLTAIKTAPVVANATPLLEFIDTYVTEMPENSVLAITSKVVSLCEGRVVKVGEVDKEELVRREADKYLPADLNKYGVMLSVKHDKLIAWAGIDESNGGGYYVLWPEHPQASANLIREHLRQRFGYGVGLVITDSCVVPMRRGTVGLGLAHSGFSALRDYEGQPDIFGTYELKYTAASILDGLASAAVLVMGEGNECTPLVLMEDLGFVGFQDRNPTVDELAALRIPMEEDLYGDVLKAAPWQRGSGRKA